jgi:UDP-N-acetyl-D-glucosamine/UDP-N-acetyl-D-galactosamine dehydrogenase
MFPSSPKITVIGLGYVGLPLAVEFARHFDVVGFDINVRRVEELDQGRDSTREVDTKELNAAGRLSFSSRIENIADCNVYIVTVPTPIDQVCRPDLRPLIAASRTVGKVLKPGNIVIYESTVYPGCTEEDCVPILEEVSGLKALMGVRRGDGRFLRRVFP